MATTNYMAAYGAELGKLIAKREGLDINKVAKEWKAEGDSTGPVMVTLHIPVIISRAEWNSLSAAADVAAQEIVKEQA